VSLSTRNDLAGETPALPGSWEFRPEPADPFWACARPAKTRAKEHVPLFSFQAEAVGCLVEAAKFLGGAHPFRKSFGKRGTLAAGHTDAVEAGDGVPADVALGIKRPIGGCESSSRRARR